MIISDYRLCLQQFKFVRETPSLMIAPADAGTSGKGFNSSLVSEIIGSAKQ